MQKEIWVRADVPDSKEERKEILIGAIESGVTTAIIRPDDKDFSSLGKIRLLVPGKDVTIVDITSPEDQEKAMKLVGKTPAAVMSSSDWTIIPMENLIAKFSGTGTKVMACASDPEEAKLYLGVMEKGVDGIVISVDDPGKVKRFADLTARSESHGLVEITVTGVRNIEKGDRVCIDAVSNMVPGEGMLIGSQASCLFLVQSESEDSGYVAARPFRVNAGAVHSYIMVPSGKTQYLGEMRSGDGVAIVCRDGSTRISSVGRCKVEIRPMVIVEAEHEGKRYSTILQNAETVKLISKEGAISVTDLKPGDRVLAKLESGGRHFGMKVEETLREV